MRNRSAHLALTALVAGVIALATAAPRAADVEVHGDVPERVDDLVALPNEAQEIARDLYKIEGQGAIFLINTPDGSVVIDTGIDNASSVRQKAIIDEIAAKPVRKIILTHFHPDHIGGLPLWEAERAAGAEVVAHQRLEYMARIQAEAMSFFLRRYDEIYPDLVDETATAVPSYLRLVPDRRVYPGHDHAFELGGVEFQVIATRNGGEGEDGLLVWLPQRRALFVGDLFGPLYPMFPNLYTVRGEKYRDPLDYIDALDRVLELDPLILAPTHPRFLTDHDYIRASVTRMRDAVQYMWDETIAGMNAGKTVWQLMEEIELPPELQLSQGHGKLSWSVRGAWELVTGWYHYDSVANLYHVPPDAVHGDVVELAGGPDRIAERARVHLEADRPLHALRLLDLARGRETPPVLEARAAALELLLERAAALNNYSEIGLLRSDLRRTREALGPGDE